MSNPMTQDGPTPSEPTLTFLQVAKFSSAFACGVMGGFLYSLKRVNPSLELEFGLGSVLMAVLSAGLALVLWRFVAALATAPGPTTENAARKRKIIIITGVGGLLFLGMLASYFYALKDVRRAALLQVLQGTTFALFVLGGIGVILVRLARMLNRNEPPTGSTGLPPEEGAPHDDAKD